ALDLSDSLSLLQPEPAARRVVLEAAIANCHSGDSLLGATFVPGSTAEPRVTCVGVGAPFAGIWPNDRPRVGLNSPSLGRAVLAGAREKLREMSDLPSGRLIF